MDIKVTPSKLNGEIQMPASKSMAHRVLIASFLSCDKTLIDGRLVGRDVHATLGILQTLGARIECINASLSYKSDVLSIESGEIASIKNAKPTFGSVENDSIKNEAQTLYCDESGSTLRFMLPIVSALNLSVKFVLGGRLFERPIDDLLCELERHGVTWSKGSSSISVHGQLRAGDYQIDGNISSQYITGLLFALPLLDGDSTITVCGDLVSEGYVNLTLETLNAFKIKVERNGNFFNIFGRQKYISPKRLAIEGDWSTACFFAVGGVLCGNIKLLGLDIQSKQGDRIVLELLQKMGAKVQVSESLISISQKKLHSIEFSCENCPDIVPVLAVAMANAVGVSKIFAVDRLKGKECDRLLATMEMLNNMGINCSVESDCLTIVGGDMTGAKLNCYNDHRMAMSATIAGLVANGKTEVLGAQCVDKSFGDFFDEVRRLGGDCNEE